MSEKEPYKPHKNFSDEINDAIIESELEGGADLELLEVGKKLEIETQSNNTYTIEKRADGYYASDKKRRLLTPMKIVIIGSRYSREGSLTKINFIGRGLFLEFKVIDENYQGEKRNFLTSRIKDVKELS